MKKCTYCAEEIQDAAVVCKHCGRDLRTGLHPSAQVQTRTPSPGIAALLSLVIPGARQIYSGNVGGRLLWMILVIIGYALFIAGIVVDIGLALLAAANIQIK